jgi:hypothetical protein
MGHGGPRELGGDADVGGLEPAHEQLRLLGLVEDVGVSPIADAPARVRAAVDSGQHFDERRRGVFSARQE